MGKAAWRRLRSARVAVVGAGRNGSSASLVLALLGVGGLVLIDPDRDELHNLDATPLPADSPGLGRLKVLNRRDALARVRPDGLSVEAVGRSLLDPLAFERL
jgi:adenylyltransferase/sulfurtransferase